jgi:hypothetical protein
VPINFFLFVFLFFYCNYSSDVIQSDDGKHLFILRDREELKKKGEAPKLNIAIGAAVIYGGFIFARNMHNRYKEKRRPPGVAFFPNNNNNTFFGKYVFDPLEAFFNTIGGDLYNAWKGLGNWGNIYNVAEMNFEGLHRAGGAGIGGDKFKEGAKRFFNISTYPLTLAAIGYGIKSIIKAGSFNVDSSFQKVFEKRVEGVENQRNNQREVHKIVGNKKVDELFEQFKAAYPEEAQKYEIGDYANTLSKEENARLLFLQNIHTLNKNLFSGDISTWFDHYMLIGQEDYAINKRIFLEKKKELNKVNLFVLNKFLEEKKIVTPVFDLRGIMSAPRNITQNKKENTILQKKIDSYSVLQDKEYVQNALQEIEKNPSISKTQRAKIIKYFANKYEKEKLSPNNKEKYSLIDVEDL